MGREAGLEHPAIWGKQVDDPWWVSYLPEVELPEGARAAGGAECRWARVLQGMGPHFAGENRRLVGAGSIVVCHYGARAVSSRQY